MSHYDVVRLARVSAVNTEVAGMIAENQARHVAGESPSYGEEAFSEKAAEINNLAHCPEECL